MKRCRVVVSLLLTLILFGLLPDLSSTGWTQNDAGNGGAQPPLPPLASPPHLPWTPQALKIEIYEDARRYADWRGYRFGPGADSDIRFAAQRAAQRIVSLPNAEEELERVKSRFHYFIDNMIISARTIPGYSIQSPGTIGEQTYYRARQMVCPLWPFC